MHIKPITLVLISGKSNAGKGIVADLLVGKLMDDAYNNVIRCSLSTYIRNIALRDFYWDGKDTPESRKFMAEVYRIGTEFYKHHMARRVWERNIEPNLLREKCITEDLGYHRGIQRTGQTFIKVKHNIAIVESFREKQNYEYFANLQAEDKIQKIITLRVESDKYSKVEDTVKTHVSETDLDDFIFDHVIYNNGSIQDLEKKVVQFISMYLTPKEK